MYFEYLGGENLDSWVTLPNGRHQAVDMLRGILRDAGLSRFKASTVCWCVNNFAASHYGPENDGGGNGAFVKLYVYV